MSEPDCSQQAYAEAQYDHDYRKLEADNERLRGLLREARNSGMLWTGIAQRIDAALSTNSSEISSGLVVTDQPDAAPSTNSTEVSSELVDSPLVEVMCRKCEGTGRIDDNPDWIGGRWVDRTCWCPDCEGQGIVAE